MVCARGREGGRLELRAHKYRQRSADHVCMWQGADGRGAFEAMAALLREGDAFHARHTAIAQLPPVALAKRPQPRQNKGATQRIREREGVAQDEAAQVSAR